MEEILNEGYEYDDGIEPTEETLEAVLDFIFTNVGIDEPGLQRQIRREFARVMK